MRRDWDERAQKDAFHYVATWRKDWTRETFLESGNEEYVKLVEPVLEEFEFVPDGAYATERRYLGASAVLETTFTTGEGAPELESPEMELLLTFWVVPPVIAIPTTVEDAPVEESPLIVLLKKF